MNNSKLVQVLKSFSPKELQKWAAYVQSPFFNTNKKVLPLLNYLLKKIPLNDNSSLEKKVIFKQVYSSRCYDENYLRKQFSILFQLLKGYLAQVNWQTSELNRELALLQSLEKRQLDSMYQIHEQALLKNINNQNRPNGDRFYFQYQLHKSADNFFSKKQKRQFDTALQEKVNNLDAFYLIEKLKGSCEMLNRKKIVAGNYEWHLVDEILQFLNQENPLSEIPMIKIYLQIFKTLQDETNENNFNILTSLLEKHQMNFPQEEAVAMYRYAQNFCIRKINQGQTEYFRKLFGLFQTQLVSKINLPNGVISADDYKNIVTVGLRIKEATWVKEFIFNYKAALSSKVRENVFNYNLASFYFGTKDYDAAIQLLSTVQYTDIYYEISGKIILAKIYFIIEETSSLNYFIDAFKLSLKRNKKIAAQYRTSINNFLIQLKKVTRFRADKNYLDKKNRNKKHQQLKQRIETITPIIERNWLLQNLETEI
jgi:hypothetical protein